MNKTINKKIQTKRIKDMKKLYSLVMKDNEKNKENIYQIIKKNKNDKEKLNNELLNIIYHSLENTIAITLQESRKMFHSFDENKIIKIEELLYQKDNKTLEERIKYWITNTNNVMILFSHICLILDTETMQVMHQTIKQKTNIVYVEIIGTGGCELCASYYDGELHSEDEIDSPPYHPGCLCEEIMYDEADILQEII